MSASHIVIILLTLAVACSTSSLHVAAQGAMLAGKVLDQNGKALSGATVTISSQHAPTVAKQTVSGLAGDYRFTNLVAGDYAVTAELAGYATLSRSAIVSSSSADVVYADLTLLALPPIGTNQPAQSHLQFQASGIHGLIDPGGYSASASAGAATSLLRGIADIKRTDRGFLVSIAKDWPCDLEPRLRKSLADHPNDIAANRDLGSFYVAHAQPTRAIPLLQLAMQMDAADAATQKVLGMAWIEDGQFEDARRLLVTLAARQSAAHDSAHHLAEVHQLLGRAEEGSGLFRQAAETYRLANSLEPSEESAFGAGYELVLAGVVDKALAAFESGIQKYPQSIPMRTGQGSALFLLGHSSESLHTFLDAADIDPSDPQPYAFVVAASALSSNEAERVRNSLKRFLDEEPGSALANYFYAIVLCRQETDDDTKSPETLLKRAIELDPGLAKAHLRLADLYAQRNDFERAAAEYQAVLRVTPDLSDAHYRLSLVSKRLGRTKESMHEMEVFEQTKSTNSSGAVNGEINIAQFISVIEAPASQPDRITQCASVGP